MVEVKGLSMAPFLNDFELVLVAKPQSEIKIGSCYLSADVIHRAITKNGNLKGDRLLYDDRPESIAEKRRLVIGRVIKKSPLVISYYGHPVLITLSQVIAQLSRYNREKMKIRLVVVILIINLSKLHRFLENFLTMRAE